MKPGILGKLDNIYKDVEQILHSTHYSPHTVRAYLGQLKAFIETVSPKLPSELSIKEIKTYIAYLNKSGRSRFSSGILTDRPSEKHPRSSFQVMK